MKTETPSLWSSDPDDRAMNCVDSSRFFHVYLHYAAPFLGFVDRTHFEHLCCFHCFGRVGLWLRVVLFLRCSILYPRFGLHY